MGLDEASRVNREVWDEHAALHASGATSYPVEAFKAGRAGLRPNTPDDLGDVRGKRMLHLQCHFGMDSLMWVRQGAIVTGVDFSPVGIAEAKKLSEETGLVTEFIEADVCALPDRLSGEFDLVVNYFGVLPWVGDLRKWARGISRCLKSGGVFYLADCHPIALAMEVADGELVPWPCVDYFGDGKAVRYESLSGTYAAPSAETRHNVSYQWPHSLQEIIGSLIEAGMRIEYLHEFPYTYYEKYSGEGEKIMWQDEREWWRLIKGDGFVPLMFSIQARND
jgi:SAM-dependent methyltransferase